MRSGADVLGLQQTAAKKKSMLPRAPANRPRPRPRHMHSSQMDSVGLHDGYREPGPEPACPLIALPPVSLLLPSQTTTLWFPAQHLCQHDRPARHLSQPRVDSLATVFAGVVVLLMVLLLPPFAKRPIITHQPASSFRRPAPPPPQS